MADDSPDALEKLVDSLLASPAYGEGHARWWLDAARYADTNGQDENKVMASAWRYRDWVVSAFNRNQPFNDFITDQLAGDLLADSGNQEEQASRLTATGFLVLGPKMLAEQDKEKLVMDIVDEQVDTVGRAFMGLTLGCARCHDHKFDPVTARDYYALAGIFKSTKVMEDLAFVSKFNERPLEPPARLTAVKEHAERAGEVKKRLDEVTAKANEALLAAWRRDFPRILQSAAGTGSSDGLDAGMIEKLKIRLHPDPAKNDAAANSLAERLRQAAAAPAENSDKTAAALLDQPELKDAFFGKDGVLALPENPQPSYPVETREALAVLEKERDALAAAAPPPVAQALAAADAPRVQFSQTGNLRKSPWEFRPRGRCGAMISDLFPRMGAMADDLCIIKSVHGTNEAHGGALLKLHTGSDTFVRPSMGSWISYGLGTENGSLPSFITINPTFGHGGVGNWSSAFLPATHQGTPLSGGKGQEGIAWLGSPAAAARQRTQLDLLGNLNRDCLSEWGGADDELEARIQSYELAFRMQTEAPEVLDLSGETEATRKLYGLDDPKTAEFGRN